MPWPVHPTGFFGARGDSDTYRIERSLRFNSGDSAYLTRTFSGTPYTYTLSWWVKRGALSTSQLMFGSRQGASNPSWIEFQTDNTIKITLGVNSAVLTTTRVFRDPSAWYHLVLSVTASGASYFYVNGIQVGTWTSSATPYLFNSSYTNAIGRYGDANQNYFDGYLTEINFIDGQALTPSSFGETDVITGRWKARAYGGTYGTTGFYLSFKDNTSTTTLGYDDAGSNDWTLNNFSVTAGTGNDSLVDSPTNYGEDTGLGGEMRGNYTTLNPLEAGGNGTFSNGNLDVVAANSTGNPPKSTIPFPSIGKWYWEVTYTTTNNSQGLGIIASTSKTRDTNSFIYAPNGTKIVNGSSSSYGSSYTNGDVIGFSLDMDLGTLTCYKNNSSQGNIATGLTGEWNAMIAGGGGLTASASFNFGQRPFAYTAPSGFKALCTQNLTQPTIQKPSRYMDALAYTGTGASNSISSLGFSPDLVWIKNRGTTTNHAIYDTTRGTQAQLSSNTTGDEVTSSTGLTSFDANGFTIGTSTLVNTSGTQYVAWGWDESVQAGMDIVSYTGNGANRTISHNLGVAPKLIIVKARTTAGADQGWPVYHASNTAAPETDYLLLNSTAASADLDTVWNDTAPTASVFSVGTSALVNTNNDTYIAYLFSEVEGFSKFGSYTGNGSADGPFAWCGFRPRWVMIKNSSSAYAWIVYDTARNTENLVTLKLAPNNSQEENGSSIGGVTFNTMDILSNGFKLRSTNVDSNASGNTIIFAAFAESPFKYARAR